MNIKTLFASSILLLAGLNVISQKTSIEGQLSNYAGIDSISLLPVSPTSAFKGITVPVEKNGSFKMVAEIPGADFYRMSVSSKNFSLLILKPKEKVRFSADAQNLFESQVISGAEENKIIADANAYYKSNEKKKDSLRTILTNEFEMVAAKEEAYTAKTIRDNLTSLASLLLIEKLDKDRYAEVYFELNEKLSATYPEHPIVKEFSRQIEEMKFLAPGQLAPEILLNGTDGKPIKLSSLKGKLVLVDFWATWCAPCMAEMPSLKRVYNEYKDKGFEIYSVSLDRTKEKWLSKASTMPWICVFDENNEASSTYKVSSIPFTVLVGRDGKIIAKSLRGEMIEQTVGNHIK